MLKNIVDWKFTVVLLGLALLPTKNGIAQTVVGAIYYWDTRHFNTTELLVSSSDIGAGISLWGFTDFHSDQSDETHRYDNSRSFSEYRFSSGLLGIENTGWQIEYNDSTPGDKNALLRAGLTYKAQASFGWLQFRVFPIQSQGQGQASLVYNMTLGGRFSISGFADYNVPDSGDAVWVVEPQLNFALTSNAWAVMEYRYNGYEAANPAMDGEGIAAGVRYDF